MVKISWVSLIFFLSVFTVLPSKAVWKGTTAEGDKRAVPVFSFPKGACSGSGWLYSPRIVFTVGHGLFKGNDLEVPNSDSKRWKKLWVGPPGEKISMNSRRIESVKLLLAPNYKGRDAFVGGNTITRTNDFAIIILKEPLPIDDKKVELLTPELHERYIENQESITSIGYGAQKAQDIDQSKGCDFKRVPMQYNSTVSAKNVDVGNQIWTAPLNFKSAPDGPSGCNGDSGSGYIKILDEKYIYLGAAGAGSKNHPNCGSNLESINSESIMGAWPIYLYLDLIKEAEAFVAANPYKPSKKKSEISCTKGKKVFVIQDGTRFCPPGYMKN
jgi:hypothetical protein